MGEAHRGAEETIGQNRKPQVRTKRPSLPSSLPPPLLSLSHPHVGERGGWVHQHGGEEAVAAAEGIEEKGEEEIAHLRGGALLGGRRGGGGGGGGGGGEGRNVVLKP